MLGPFVEKDTKFYFVLKSFKIGLNIGVEYCIAFFRKKDQKVSFLVILGTFH